MDIIELTINTSQQCQMLDITSRVRHVLERHSLQKGVATLFVPHTTAALTINENADPDVKTDLLLALDRISPDLPQFKHMEGNSSAHVKSSLLGCSLQLIVNNGKLLLGTWQGIYYCEFDGPRTRKLLIHLPEA